MSAPVGRPLGDISAGVRHGHLINNRIRALVGQALDELERRARAKGRSDVVSKIADEIEKNPLAALKSLQELLPKDDVAGKTPVQNNVALFVQAAREMSMMGRDQSHDAVARDAAPMASLLELTAQPVTDVTPSADADDIEW